MATDLHGLARMPTVYRDVKSVLIREIRGRILCSAASNLETKARHLCRARLKAKS
jgi:hypothetical protein